MTDYASTGRQALVNGLTAFIAGDWRTADSWYSAAIGSDDLPTEFYRGAYLDAGLARLKLGDREGASEAFTAGGISKDRVFQQEGTVVDPDVPVDRILEDVEGWIENGQYETALSLLTQALPRLTGFAEELATLRRRLAEAYVGAGRLDEARSVLRAFGVEEDELEVAIEDIEAARTR